MIDHLEIAQRALQHWRTETGASAELTCLPEWLGEPADEHTMISREAEAVPHEVWMDWTEWKAAALNRLFQEQGVTGELGNITAATVRHGENRVAACPERREALNAPERWTRASCENPAKI